MFLECFQCSAKFENDDKDKFAGIKGRGYRLYLEILLFRDTFYFNKNYR